MKNIGVIKKPAVKKLAVKKLAVKKPAACAPTMLREPLDLNAFAQQLQVDDFNTSTVFLEKVRFAPFPMKASKEVMKKGCTSSTTGTTYYDCLPLRAFLVFVRFNAVPMPKWCTGCKRPCQILQYKRTDFKSLMQNNVCIVFQKLTPLILHWPFS